METNTASTSTYTSSAQAPTRLDAASLQGAANQPYAVLAVAGDERPRQSTLGLQELFDALAHAVFVVDALGRLHYANPKAKHSLEQRECLTLRHAHPSHQTANTLGSQSFHIAATHAPDQSALSNAIQRASLPTSRAQRSVLRLRITHASASVASTSRLSDSRLSTSGLSTSQTSTSLFAASRSSVLPTTHTRELIVLVTPLESPQRHGYPASAEPCANLVAIQLERQALCDPSVLCLFSKSFALTSAEQRVLALLCDGLEAPDIAASLRVAVSTIRSHIKALCNKTGGRSIRQVVQRVALLPAVAGRG